VREWASRLCFASRLNPTPLRPTPYTLNAKAGVLVEALVLVAQQLMALAQPRFLPPFIMPTHADTHAARARECRDRQVGLGNGGRGGG